MDYYDILIDGISAEIYVSRIIHTRSWIAAELSDGRYGIALHDKLQSRERMFPTLEGLTARRRRPCDRGTFSRRPRRWL